MKIFLDLRQTNKRNELFDEQNILIMQKIIFLFYSLAVLSIFSCKPKMQDSTEIEDPDIILLYDEVMKIHDDVMPKMQDISKLRRELRKKIPTVQDSSIVYSDVLYLNKADDAMMDWMARFSEEYMSIQKKEDKISYLKNEIPAIEYVRDIMLESIAKAQRRLDSLNNL